MVFQLIARLQDGCVHLLHRIPELHAETAENIPLPCVVLGVHPGLDLLVVYDADAESVLCF
jgi:hypothetical protein